MASEQNLKDQLTELHKDYDHQKKLISGLRQKLRQQNTTNVGICFQLEAEIEEAEKKRDKLDAEILILEKKLNNNPKSTHSAYDDEFSGGNQGKIPMWVSLDSYNLQMEPEGYDGENTSAKVYAHLAQLRSAQNKDIRVPDGLKDSNRKIYKKGKHGEQILLKDDDPIFSADILESRPDAVKG
jgi:hypothetical protein